MCVFVGGIERVSNTRIFAAPGREGRQRLVYAMDLAAGREVAMILPLPVAREAGKDAVRFVDLSAYPEFFADLDALFAMETLGSADPDSVELSFGTLPVHEVGDFEASYVPSHDDWDRLDPRFRLDPALWEQLPQYHDYGFAVFQLSPGVRASVRTLHPMAFEFASRTPDEIFFPTVHIHDGQVHPTAKFDHDLFCQLPEDHPLVASFDQGDGLFLLDWQGWRRALGPVAEHVDLDRAAGLVDPGRPVLLRQIGGEHPNRDVILSGALG